MNLQEQITTGKGYAILPIENLDHFNKLREQFIDKMQFYTKEKKLDKLRTVMTSMSKSQINDLMVSLISFSEASEILINSCKNIVSSLSGEDIVL